MEITYQNKRKYVRKVLKSLIRSYYYKWIGYDPFHSGFDLEAAVNEWSKEKMEQIKRCVYENLYRHENAWYVYEEIKDYTDIKELLRYLSPKHCYSPETCLLSILRDSKKIKVINDNKAQRYYLEKGFNKETMGTKEDLSNSLTYFFREYALLLLEVKKEILTLSHLYKMLLDEELSYSFARNSEVYLYLHNKKGLDIQDALDIANQDNLKSHEEKFKDLIKKDYNRFFKVIDDFYGSKKWGDDVKFKAYLKLYDQFFHKREINKANELGEILLSLLDKSGLNNMQQEKISRLINRYLERGDR